MLGLSPSRSRASEVAPSYTLEDCVERGILMAPEVKAAMERARQASAFVDERWWSFFPKIVIDTIFTVAPGKSGDASQAEGSLFETWGPLVQLEVEGSVPLYTFGRLSAEREAASHRLAAARARVSVAVREVIFRTQTAWYRRAAGRARADVLRAALEILDEYRANLREMEAEDDLEYDQTDMLRLRVARAEVEELHLAAEREAKLGLSALRQVIGVAPDEPMDLVDEEISTALTALAPLEDYLSLAELLSHEDRARRSTELALRSEAVAATRALLPELRLAGLFRIGYASAAEPQLTPFAEDGYNSWVGAIMLTLDIPLDIPQRLGEKRVAEAAVLRAASERRLRARQLELEVARAHGKATDLLELVEVRRTAAKAARGWLFARRSLYDTGMTSLSEALTATRQWVRRSTELIDTVRDANVAVAELGRLVGTEVTPAVGDDGATRRRLPSPRDLPPEVVERLRKMGLLPEDQRRPQ